MKRGSPLDVERIAGVLAVQVASVTGPLLERLKALEAREQQHLARIGDLEARALIHVSRISELELRKLPDAVKGDDGANASDEQVADAVAKYLAAHPPAPGKPGDPGAPGKSADPVTDAQIADAVSKHLAANPPAPGKPGESIKGDDGPGFKSALIDAGGNLVLTRTDGEVVNVGPVKGKDGIDAKGTPGTDGFSCDEMKAILEGDRTIIIQFRRGEEIKEIGRFDLPAQINRGVFEEGRTYQRGDVVTWAGSQWHANAETMEKPGDGATCWTLAVKKGRDGKDGVMKPAPGPTGPLKL